MQGYRRRVGKVGIYPPGWLFTFFEELKVLHLYTARGFSPYANLLRIFEALYIYLEQDM